MLLTPEKIKQAIKDAHRRNPGKILSAMEIYIAIAQAQYKEDSEDEHRRKNLSPEEPGNQEPG